MEEHRARQQRRWLESLGLDALCRHAAENGIQLHPQMDRGAIVELLMAGGQAIAQMSESETAASSAQSPPVEASGGTSAQLQADEELARRLAAEEEARASPSAVSSATSAQIQADEELARCLAAEEEQRHQAPMNMERIAEALSALAPLREMRRRRFQGSQVGTMIDDVFQQLEDLAVSSTAASGEGGPGVQTGHQSAPPLALPSEAQALSSSQEEAIRAAARSGSVAAVLAAAGASTRLAVPAASGAARIPAASRGRPAAGTSPASGAAPSAGARAEAAGYPVSQASGTGPRPDGRSSEASTREEAIREAARSGSLAGVLTAAGVPTRLLQGLPLASTSAIEAMSASTVGSDGHPAAAVAPSTAAASAASVAAGAAPLTPAVAGEPASAAGAALAVAGSMSSVAPDDSAAWPAGPGASSSASASASTLAALDSVRQLVAQQASALSEIDSVAAGASSSVAVSSSSAAASLSSAAGTTWEPSMAAGASSSSSSSSSAVALPLASAAAASNTEGTRPPASDRFADYRARQEARREEARRRRAERLVALNAALATHAQVIENSMVGLNPAGNVQFVEDHSSTSAWSGPEDTQCVICCEDLVEGETVRTLRCGHVYHKECVDLWLRRSRLCCLCKRPIDQSGGGQ